jgi:uncharacterized membrane protein HdeD (DUF308 family)
MSVLKYLGVLILLIGVGVLAVPAFTGKSDNSYLAAGLALIIAGYLSHIFLNKKIE